MRVVIWVGLGLFALGLIILTVVALLPLKLDSRMQDVAFKAGLTLFLLGIALSIVST